MQRSEHAVFTSRPGIAIGTVRAPSSKSMTHRAYLLAAHTNDRAAVHAPLRASDTDTTLACLQQLGAHMEDHGDSVTFAPASWTPASVHCQNSGTSLRLLLGLAARMPGASSFDGDQSLRQRPNAPLLEALAKGGAKVDGTDRLPITITGPIEPGTYTLPAQVSSQYASALLLSLPFLASHSELRMTPPVSSRPYLDVTREVAAAFGIQIHAHDDTYQIPGNQTVSATEYTVEADWSGAAFPFVAAAITGGTVTVEGLRADSPQGDRGILDIIRDFGAHVRGSTVTGDSLVSPGSVDVSATPDLFPALAVLAACAEGTTTFTGGAALRHKESDRITAMAKGLTKLGIRVQEQPDGLIVHGASGELRGAKIHGYDDHRIHMAFCIAGLVANGPVTVTDPECVAISYPNFHADLAQLTEAA